MGRLEAFVSGLSVHVPSENTRVTLKSSPNAWRVEAFPLPWFSNPENHPHVIALGGSFWEAVESLTVDTVSQRVQIVPKTKT